MATLVAKLSIEDRSLLSEIPRRTLDTLSSKSLDRLLTTARERRGKQTIIYCIGHENFVAIDDIRSEFFTCELCSSRSCKKCQPEIFPEMYIGFYGAGYVDEGVSLCVSCLNEKDD